MAALVCRRSGQAAALSGWDGLGWAERLDYSH